VTYLEHRSLCLATSRHSLGLLLAVMSITGIGYALLYLGAFTLVNITAPVNHRAAFLPRFTSSVICPWVLSITRNS
jgi:hypothetical protein